MSSAHALTSVNRFYLDKVMELAQAREVKATEDIYDARGIKLVAKGTPVSRHLQERLCSHALSKPFETSIMVDDGICVERIVNEARQIIEQNEPIAALLGSTSAATNPLKVLAEMRFGSAMSTMLTILQGGGQQALQHGVLVSVLSVWLAQRCGLSINDQNCVALAGLLHDIGELYIDPEYLHSSRRLYPEEWRHVVVHPRIGQMLVEGLENYPATVAQAIFEHHERMDGGGYPRGIAQQISMPGQVVSVAEMISGIFLGNDQPLKRAELALKLVPGEHAHALVSAFTSASREATYNPSAETAPAPADETAAATALYMRIGHALEAGQTLLETNVMQSARGKELLEISAQRTKTIARAFSSTGLDTVFSHLPQVMREDNVNVLFETMVVVREIEWRMRGIARDIALQAASLEQAEAQALQSYINTLDGAEV